jgi:ribosomal peptide maturation radical SAM protein 1
MHSLIESRDGKIDACLIMLPFGPIRTPSIGLGLLKGIAIENDFNVAIRYSNVRFAAKIGMERYEKISQGVPSTVDLYGEWLMAHALSPHTSSDIDRYLDEVVMKSKFSSKYSTESRDSLQRRMRNDIHEILSYIDDFIEEEVSWICRQDARVVGLTSTFQQNTACFSVAKKIKERSPHTYIVFGGANAEGNMGRRIKAEYSFIDEVVSGEGEIAFLNILKKKCVKKKGTIGISQIPVLSSTDKNLKNPEIRELDKLPYPDYSDYFSEISRSLAPDFIPHLPFETSRGCWWGERSHCTFCGLNGTSMAYRSKSQARALRELNELIERYGNHKLDVVDNILDMEYFEEFIPNLSQNSIKLDLFYETKANLNKRQLKALAEAGISAIQPGIESLSDDSLKIMRKGIKAIHNIQLLKWAKQFGITAVWNFIWGFPGEDRQEFDQIAGIIPLLHHFEPPQGGSQIRLDRFSPLFEDRENFLLKNVRPFPAYGMVYNLTPDALFDMAYYFDFDYPDARNPSDYTATLLIEIAAWREAAPRAELIFQDFGDACMIIDTRKGSGLGGVYTMGEVETHILRLLDKASTKISLLEYADTAGIGAHDIELGLSLLFSKGLLLELSGLLIALPFNSESYSPQNSAIPEICSTIERDGILSSDGVRFGFKKISSDCPQ